jgi:hypothetical protein
VPAPARGRHEVAVVGQRVQAAAILGIPRRIDRPQRPPDEFPARLAFRSGHEARRVGIGGLARTVARDLEHSVVQRHPVPAGLGEVVHPDREAGRGEDAGSGRPVVGHSLPRRSDKIASNRHQRPKPRPGADERGIEVEAPAALDHDARGLGRLVQSRDPSGRDDHPAGIAERGERGAHRACGTHIAAMRVVRGGGDPIPGELRKPPNRLRGLEELDGPAVLDQIVVRQPLVTRLVPRFREREHSRFHI